MEISVMQMYWLLMLDNIGNFFVAATALSGLLVLFLVLFLLMPIITEANEALIIPKRIKQFVVVVISIFLFSSVVVTFVPTTKQMAAIIVLPKIINNEQVQQIPDRVLELGLEWLEDLKPEKEEK